ncbi:hypothetical protein BKN38_03670 [Helicobacter sp. CLO-3]|uniref:FtsK/SpoIIIE domain-containing protein n=1 Tax=unclassified Helicobacter TaxID=2593540 RepID=UPI000805AE9D|nr:MULTISPECIES: FtsK/SpoIIIE domain-containing protein [unclassified Helicobacter]OBV29264.1 hypothetical protein BA723_06355 [Helicobacter sp. CLO-3]OHU84136.1 hypothetical protein BKN38_03670 [Helicobacter sp. CLO-3]
MADFNTNNHEEMLIDRVRKNGFGVGDDGEFHKYFVLRVAIARALNAPLFALSSPDWEGKRLQGDKGKEYNLEQITGKGKDKKDDFDLLIRSLLYVKHKKELDGAQIDIFNDDKEYLGILTRYIQRGLYEIETTWKSSDDFYQWCLDHLQLSPTPSVQASQTAKNDGELGYFDRLYSFFKERAIDISRVSEMDSYRHHICKIELKDSEKISAFNQEKKWLDEFMGENVYVESCKGLSKIYDIQIAKPQEEWQYLGKSEFDEGLLYLSKQNYALGIFAGKSVNKEPFCFDLKDTPHLFVAGTTGSGKSVFLKALILCLLQNDNVAIDIIDPKHGVSFKEFENVERINIIKDSQSAVQCVENLVDQMEERFSRVDSGDSFDNMPYKVLIVDELNDLIDEKQDIKKSLKRLAQKAREAKIHLVLGTQRPDGTILKGLKGNIPSSVALQTKNSNESKVILDEEGAEKLLGKGDMLVHLSSGIKQRVLGVFLSPQEIGAYLQNLRN